MQSATLASLQRVCFATALTIVAIATRLLPHQANFTAVGAVALVAGCYLGWRAAAAVTVAAMLVSDAIIGFYGLPVMLSVYVSLALAGALGVWTRRPGRFSWPRVLSATLGGSLLFYLVTNFAVWRFTPLYAKTAAGLFSSYVAALPFFRNSVLADLIYGAAMFGVAEAALGWRRRPQRLSPFGLRTIGR